MKKNLLIIFIVPLTLALCGCGGSPTKPTHDEEFNFCWEALSLFFIYQERLPADPNVYATPADLYKSVNDAYTRYFDPTQALQLKQLLTTRTGGIGIRVDTARGRYVVQQVFKNSPGERAGLHVGDTLMKAGTISLSGLSRSDFSLVMQGDLGTQLTLEVKRLDATLTIKVILGEYLAPSVFTDTLDSVTAYILLTEFSDSTENPLGSSAEFSDALDKTAWAKYTVLDLRDNPGGDLQQCLGIVSQFVPKDTAIIKQKRRDYNDATGTATTIDTVMKATAGQKALHRTFAVLVDSMTASASEVLVSCLKERRASNVKIIGGLTYGKGSGWTMFDTQKKGLVTITLLLITPMVNLSYNHIGIVPDISIGPGSDAEQIALNEIHGGGLGKTMGYFSRLTRIRALRAEMRPRFWYPMCVVKSGR
jgi:carboxyl-terminal processing protease